jgi:putative hydrolase of the HAD superfamily
MIDENIAPDVFLDFVHDIDHSSLDPNPALALALAALPGRKLIFTSGSRRHAHNVIERLGVFAHFEDVFDIVSADFVPKPARETYERFLRHHGVDADKAAMFEDLSRNLEVPHALGMTTVLVVPQVSREVVREDWELVGRTAPYVHYVTDDLAAFLASLALAPTTRVA